MAGVVQFYYGSDAQKYLSEFKTGKYADALFFDTKQKVIYRNGDIYGGTGDNQGVLPEQIEGLIASVEPDDKNGLGPDYAYIYSFINLHNLCRNTNLYLNLKMYLSFLYI